MPWSWQLARSETKIVLTRAPLVAAEKQPVLPAEDLATEVALGDIVVQGQAPVVEEATEGDALVASVADGLRDGCLVEGDQCLLVAPLEERIEDRPRLLAPDLLAFLSRRGLDGALDAEEAFDQREGVLGELGLRAERLEEVPPGMRPTCHFDHVAVLVQVVVDGGGVGDEVALVAGEQEVDRVAVVRVRVAVEDVVGIRSADCVVT
jgi:hypothetical protein